MVLRREHKRLHGLDGLWEIDEMVLRQMIGTTGASKLKEMWEQRCLPRHNHARTVEDSLHASATFLRSSAFQWASSSLKGEVEACHNMLQRIQTGEAVVTSTSMSEWAAGVAVLLQEFIRFPKAAVEMKEVAGKQKKQVAKDDDDEDLYDTTSDDLVGIEALRAIFADLEHAGGAKDLEQLRVLNCWRHLLQESERTSLLEWRDRLLKGAAKPKQASQKPKAKPRKGVATEMELDATARAMFRMR